MKYDVDKYVEELKKYREAVEEYLKRKGLSWEAIVSRLPYLPNRVRFLLLPFNIDYEQVVQLLDEKQRQKVEELQNELMKRAVTECVVEPLKKALKEVQSLLENNKHASAVSELAKALNEAITKLEHIAPELAQELREVRKRLNVHTVQEVVNEVASLTTLLASKLA